MEKFIKKILLFVIFLIIIFASCTDRSQEVVVNPVLNTDSVQWLSFSPQKSYPNQIITLFGKNFFNYDSVKILLDTTEAEIILKSNDSLLIGLPNLNKGKYRIKLILDDDTLVFKDQFEVLDKNYLTELNYYSPKKGYAEQTVTIFGRNLTQKNNIKVLFNNVNAEIYFKSNDFLLVKVPNIDDGFYRITLLNGTDTLFYKDLFEVLKPIDVSGMKHCKIIISNLYCITYNSYVRYATGSSYSYDWFDTINNYTKELDHNLSDYSQPSKNNHKFYMNFLNYVEFELLERQNIINSFYFTSFNGEGNCDLWMEYTYDVKISNVSCKTLSDSLIQIELTGKEINNKFFKLKYDGTEEDDVGHSTTNHSIKKLEITDSTKVKIIISKN